MNAQEALVSVKMVGLVQIHMELTNACVFKASMEQRVNMASSSYFMKGSLLRFYMISFRC